MVIGTKQDFPHILVGTDTGGFESFRRELFVFVRNHMDTKGKFVYIGTLSAQIEDANFGVRDTTVESRFWVGLFSKDRKSALLLGGKKSLHDIKEGS